MKTSHAFTLAETLITLAIIGVVAAITLPTLITNINDKVKQNKIQTIKSKLNKSASLLNIQNGIGPYYGNEKEGTRLFLNELSKHLKIIEFCDKTTIHNCIPYDYVKKSNGETKTLEEYFTDNGTGVGMIDSSEHKYGQVMGIVLADGTSIVLTYDLKCPVSDPDSRNENPTACLHGWFDINGAKAPNTWGKDIVGFNFGYGKVFTPECIKASECKKIKTQYGIKSCLYDGDCWAGAVKQCGGVSNLPTLADLALIASAAYKRTDGSDINVGEMDSLSGNIKYDGSAVASLGISSFQYIIFTGQEASYVGAYGRYYNYASKTQTSARAIDRRTHTPAMAFCTSD